MGEKDLKDHILSILIKAPREKVWAEITKIGELQRPVMNTVLQGPLKPGGKLRYLSGDGKNGFVVGKVVELSPPSRFSHTFMFTTRPEEPTLVIWDLEEDPEGTRVTLTHRGWKNQVKTHKGVVKGWAQILKLLKMEVETGKIPVSTKIKYRILGTLTFLLPKSTRIEEIKKGGW